MGEERKGIYHMIDGVVILEDRTVGVFTISIDDTIHVSLNNNQSLRETLEHASDNGMTMELLATPATPHD